MKRLKDLKNACLVSHSLCFSVDFVFQNKVIHFDLMYKRMWLRKLKEEEIKKALKWSFGKTQFQSCSRIMLRQRWSAPPHTAGKLWDNTASQKIRSHLVTFAGEKVQRPVGEGGVPRCLVCFDMARWCSYSFRLLVLFDGSHFSHY